MENIRKIISGLNSVEDIIFKEKVRNLSAKEIILTMLSAIRGHKKSHLTSYQPELKYEGLIADIEFLTLLKLYPKFPIKKGNIESKDKRAEVLGVSVELLSVFECMIYELSRGDLYWYNRYADMVRAANIENPKKIVLQKIDYSYQEYILEGYEKLAESQS